MSCTRCACHALDVHVICAPMLQARASMIYCLICHPHLQARAAMLVAREEALAAKEASSTFQLDCLVLYGSVLRRASTLHLKFVVVI